MGSVPWELTACCGFITERRVLYLNEGKWTGQAKPTWSSIADEQTNLEESGNMAYREI